VTFHLSKLHWFNAQTRGIQLETCRDARPGRELALTLHLLHEEVIPGSDRKRVELCKRVGDELEKWMKSWWGYTFKPGKYGLQFFKRVFRTSAPDLSAHARLNDSNFFRAGATSFLAF